MNTYEKSITKKGHTTYKYDNKFIYSGYDPVREATRYVNTQNELKNVVITCCGADYINEALLTTKAGLIISFDPIAFDNTLKAPNLYRGNTIGEIEKILLNKNIHAGDISLLVWPPLIESNRDFYLPLLQDLKKTLFKTSISSNTAKSFAFTETYNVIKNYFTYKDHTILQKNSTPIPQPALIISSGKSLEDGLSYIKSIANYSYLFALPSALPFLSANNIAVDYCVAVDPGYATYYHISKYNQPLSLITPLTITPSVLKLHNIKPYIFNYETPAEKKIFNITGQVRTHAEGSVFINTLRILPQLGFSKALIFGQDFGFKDNRSHVKEGIFEKEFIYWSGHTSPVETRVCTLESNLQKKDLTVCNRTIRSTTAYKLYYEHFIKQKFDIELLLPDTCYNPISDTIKKVNASYITTNFPKKEQNKKILSSKAIKTSGFPQTIIDDLINNNEKDIYYDKQNPLHKHKIKKLYGIKQ